MKTQKEVNLELLKQLELQKQLTKEFQGNFETEKNIKNGLYFFILKNKMFDKLKDFEPFANYQNSDYHNKSLLWFIANAKETQN